VYTLVVFVQNITQCNTQGNGLERLPGVLLSNGFTRSNTC